MRTRLTRMLACAAMAWPMITMPAWAARAQAPGAQVSDGVVKVGVLPDMSGMYADLSGPGSVAAAQKAVEDFGGTVLGKPVVVVSADHQDKPDVGASIARAWYDREQVDATSARRSFLDRLRQQPVDRFSGRTNAERPKPKLLLALNRLTLAAPLGGEVVVSRWMLSHPARPAEPRPAPRRRPATPAAVARRHAAHGQGNAASKA